MTEIKDPLTELVQFLDLDSRFDLKTIALDHVVGLSASRQGVDTFLKNKQIITKIIDLIDDKNSGVAKNATVLLVNVTASENGAKEILKYKPSNHKNVIESLISCVMNSQKGNADASCMVLSNVTRLEDELDSCIQIILPHLNDILNVFVNTDFNKTGCKLHYLAPMISNLSRSKTIQKWLIEEHPYIPLIKLLPFCNYAESSTRRGGVVGTLRNLSFSTEFHDFLLRSDIDLLTYILNPLMGNEDYPDEEMDLFPIALQYLPQEKVRESDPDIRKMLIEILNRFCVKRSGREKLRSCGVYYVLREYHKWEKDPRILLACENVVDILIRTEDEIGVEDLSSVDVTEEMKANFERIDEEFVNGSL